MIHHLLDILTPINHMVPLNKKYCAELNTQRTVRGHKLDHLAINSTTAVAGKTGCTLASPATAVIEFMAKWLNLYPSTVSTHFNFNLLSCTMNPNHKIVFYSI